MTRNIRSKVNRNTSLTTGIPFGRGFSVSFTRGKNREIEMGTRSEKEKDLERLIPVVVGGTLENGACSKSSFPDENSPSPPSSYSTGKEVSPSPSHSHIHTRITYQCKCLIISNFEQPIDCLSFHTRLKSLSV